MVLKTKVSDDQVKQMIQRKKTGLFGSPLNRPKGGSIHVHSVCLKYEAILHVCARYKADYLKKAIHTISVPYNVREVILGDGTFQIQKKSRFSKMLSGRRGKNKINLELEEHTFVDEQGQIYLDHHGREVKFPYDTGHIESYPSRVLEASDSVERHEMTVSEAVDMLRSKLIPHNKTQMRDMNEEFTVTCIDEIYVPIYEARLVGPNKKIAILRIDAVRAKIL